MMKKGAIISNGKKLQVRTTATPYSAAGRQVVMVICDECKPRDPRFINSVGFPSHFGVVELADLLPVVEPDDTDSNEYQTADGICSYAPAGLDEIPY